MIYYIEVNKNPKKKRTGDCSTRALCNILDISINDLFSGKIVDMKDSEKKLEENLIKDKLD